MQKTFIIISLILINIITFLLFVIDKRKAERHQWRIPETTLLGFSLIGGALGGIIGMMLYHHKVRKPHFSIGLPMILIIQISLYLNFFQI